MLLIRSLRSLDTLSSLKILKVILPIILVITILNLILYNKVKARDRPRAYKRLKVEVGVRLEAINLVRL